MPTAAAESAAYERDYHAWLMENAVLLPGMVAERYADVRRHTALETSLPLAVLPETCPFRVDQLLDDAFMGGRSA